MKRKFFLAVVAISLPAACGQAAINTIVETKITNSTPDVCTIRSVRDVCNEKRCLLGYSIFIAKK